jgi:hypothetical protein
MAEKFCRKWRLPRHFWVLLYNCIRFNDSDMNFTIKIKMMHVMTSDFVATKSDVITCNISPTVIQTLHNHRNTGTYP